MQSLHKLSKMENNLRSEQLKRSNSIEHATLIGHIGRTFSDTVKIDEGIY